MIDISHSVVHISAVNNQELFSQARAVEINRHYRMLRKIGRRERERRRRTRQNGEKGFIVDLINHCLI